MHSREEHTRVVGVGGTMITDDACGARLEKLGRLVVGLAS